MKSEVYPLDSVYAQVYYDRDNHISHIELHNTSDAQNDAFIQDSVKLIEYIKDLTVKRLDNKPEGVKS